MGGGRVVNGPMKNRELMMLAGRVARDAYEHHFRHHDGTFADLAADGIDYAAYFSNHPNDRRDAALQEVVAEMGDRIRAMGVWPFDGESAGYTYSILVRAQDEADLMDANGRHPYR